MDQTVHRMNQTVHVMSQTVHRMRKNVHVMHQTVHRMNQTVHVMSQTVHVMRQTVHVMNQTVHGMHQTVHRMPVIHPVIPHPSLQPAIHPDPIPLAIGTSDKSLASNGMPTYFCAVAGRGARLIFEPAATG